MSSTSVSRGTGDGVTQRQARNDVPGQTGRRVRADEEGLAADGTGVLLEPGGGVGRFVRGFRGKRRRLAVGQQTAAAEVCGLPGTRVEPIMTDGLIAGRGHVLQIPAQKFVNGQGLDLGPLPSAGGRVVGPPSGS